MRKLALLAMLFLAACKTTTPPPPATEPAPAAESPAPVEAAEPHGMTVEEEAQVLALEDRREFDATLINTWLHHPNSLHRLRIALALGRIGPHTHSGVTELASLVNDPDRRVREMAGFSLGEIGDPAGADALFTLANGDDAGVAAEAVEAISKVAARDKSLLPRYLALVTNHPEGVRARAVRFLFRWESDEASAVAMQNLGDASDAVRQEAAYALQRRPYAPAREQLLLVMNDPNTLTRAYATAALGRIADPSAMPALLTALSDMHPWVRTNAAIAIGRVAEKTRSALSSDDLPRILGSLRDPDAGTRAMMLDTLAYYAESNASARQRLIDVFQNGSAWERELAAGAIAKHLGVTPELTNLGPWQIVRVVEATAAKPEGVAVRAQYATHSDPLVRANVIAAIPDANADSEAAIIRAGLADADVIVRANALDRYSAMKSEPQDAMIKTLQEAERRETESSMNDARLVAIGALAKIDYPERATLLQALLADPDPVVRRFAADQTVSELKATTTPSYTPLAVKRTMDDYMAIVRWSREPHTARIKMTRGNIDLALMTQDAPMTTWNFATLARQGYFDNSSFMRVVPNFVIQGGDPRNDMNGGPGYAIRDEINLQKYTRGAVGMALSGPDTGGSQFFITHSPQPHLDGGYTIFGRVYDGMTGVVDQTERGDRVLTITIDEQAAATDAQISSVPNVSLPLEIGPITSEKMLTRLPEYTKRRDEYKPDITVLEMMKSYVQAGDHVEVFMGTWCSDSQREVPKFLRILDDLKSNFGVELPASYVAVDRAKHEPATLIGDRHIDKVATFIYYRGDHEVGRITERPTSPQFEDDMLALLVKP